MISRKFTSLGSATTLALCLQGLCAFTRAAEASPASPFIAHRAVYDLSLGKAGGAGAPSSARGRIVYEFTGSACEGYVTNFRQITEIQSDEGGSRTSDMRSTTFEEADGSGFRFKTDSYVDGKLVESIDGKASKSADGGLSVALTKPAPAKSDFEPAPLFPTAQLIQVLDVARKGGKTDEVKIYDGSDGGMKLFDTMSVIGHQTEAPPTDPVAAHAEGLKGVRRWPVTISYFDGGKPDGEPNYVLAFDLYENGVSGALKINYGSYALDGQMSKFELLPQKACTK
jgi:hypothetical protein